MFLSEYFGQYLRTKARAPHPKQQRVAEPLASYFASEVGEFRDILALRAVEPAEPFVLVGIRPEGFVFPEKPANVSLRAPILGRYVDTACKRRIERNDLLSYAL